MPVGVGLGFSHHPIQQVLLGAALAGLLMGAIGWFYLPEWIDSKHPEWSGALVIGCAAVIASILVVVAF